MVILSLCIIIFSLSAGSSYSYGGLIMLGPLPISFGSSAAMALAAMVLGFAMLVFFMLFFYGSMKAVSKSEGEKAINGKDVSVKGGGVVMVGPIPIAFGTDAKYLIYIMILAVILMSLAIFIMVLR